MSIGGEKAEVMPHHLSEPLDRLFELLLADARWENTL